MLREFNRIAREMLFMHGHLTRPRDWAQAPAAQQTPSGRPTTRNAKKNARWVAAAATGGMLTTTRLVVGQLR